MLIRARLDRRARRCPVRSLAHREAGELMVRTFMTSVLILSAASPTLAGDYPILRDRSKYGSMPHEQVDATIRDIARFRHLRRRVLSHSSLMIGANYRPDPLGEGQQGRVDSDPRFQLAPVDCVTFVESTLAMALAGDLDQAKRWMDRLRYSGTKVGFARRNHFMLANWLPHLKRHRVLRDITRTIGEGDTLVHDYDQMNWSQIAPRFLPSNFDSMHPPKGRVELPLVNLDTLEANLKAVPNGTILLLVRVERPRIPVRISHLGFVIHQKSGRTIFRHASQEGWGRVVDEDLIRYLRRLDNRSKWAIQGVSLQLPRHPKTLPGTLLEPDQIALKGWLP